MNPFDALRFVFLGFAALGALLLLFKVQRDRENKIKTWIGPTFWRDTVRGDLSSKTTLIHGFLGISVVLLGLALARPQWGIIQDETPIEAVDIMVAIDLSNSMITADTAPNRLDRVKQFLRAFVRSTVQDRIGFTVFARSATLMIPLTQDRDYLLDRIDTLDPSILEDQGTRFAPALKLVAQALDRGAESDAGGSRAVVFVSDGEDHSGSVDRALDLIKDPKPLFFFVGVGTAEGGPIPLKNRDGGIIGYVKDKDGKPVVSRFNPEVLKALAEKTSGQYLQLINPDDASGKIWNTLGKIRRNKNGVLISARKHERFFWFLIPAFFTLLFAYSYPLFKRSRLAIFFLLIGTSSIPMMKSEASSAITRSIPAYRASRAAESAMTEPQKSQALDQQARQADPQSPALWYNEGVSTLRNKGNDEAKKLFSKSAELSLIQGDFSLAAKALYNKGLTQKETKDLGGAIETLSQAIEAAKVAQDRPLEEKARQALRVAAQQKSQQQSQEKSQDSPEKNQNQKDQNQQDQKKQDAPRQGGDKSDEDKKYKSESISQDMAERIMNDLSEKERALLKGRMRF